MDTVGRYLYVLDSQFCPKRLQNTPGFAVYSGNGIKFTKEPRVDLTEMEVAEGDKWSHIVVALGSDGIFRRILPAAGADGVLKADGNGNWTLEDISSSFTVPDPLTLTTLNVSNLNTGATTVSDVVTFSVLGTDTITQTIGLNSSNELVKGAIAPVSAASYFENQSLTDSGTPNWYPASATDYCVIGNELSDPDGIASVQDSRTIRIDKDGDYIIRWRGNFVGWNPDSSSTDLGANFKNPGIYLTINSAVVDWGIKAIYQNKYLGGAVGGEYHAIGLTTGALVKLQLNGSIQTSTTTSKRTGLSGVGLTLQKIK